MAKPKTATEQAGQITQRKLRELMKSSRSAQKDIQEIAGGLGSQIKTAVENDHLHRKAFSVIKTADKMEPEKLAEFFDCLDYYRDISGLNERAASAPKLEIGDDRGEETVKSGKGANGNVKAFPQPASVLDS